MANRQAVAAASWAIDKLRKFSIDSTRKWKEKMKKRRHNIITAARQSLVRSVVPQIVFQIVNEASSQAIKLLNKKRLYARAIAILNKKNAIQNDGYGQRNYKAKSPIKSPQKSRVSPLTSFSTNQEFPIVADIHGPHESFLDIRSRHLEPEGNYSKELLDEIAGELLNRDTAGIKKKK